MSNRTTTQRDQERELEELRVRVAKLESERDKRKRAEDALLEHQDLLLMYQIQCWVR